jgi:competence protein ComEA
MPRAFSIVKEPLMPNRLICLAFFSALVLSSSGAALAADKAKVATAALAASPAQAVSQQASPRVIDINSGSRTDLKTLPGIGDAQADRIIAARPYPSKTKLVVDKVISEQTYQALKGRIVAVQPAAPKLKLDGKATPKS